MDIAPTEHLKNYLNSKVLAQNYRSADLFMKDVDDNVDIQAMDIYPDNSWDLVICSHVLEHVPDDIKALSEIYRVLKKGGVAILMAPINLGLEKVLKQKRINAIPFLNVGNTSDRTTTKDYTVKTILSKELNLSDSIWKNWIRITLANRYLKNTASLQGVCFISERNRKIAV